ncbi:hypothetical protein LJC31_03370 [Synergistaceae bacterium OttesenSCG-928-I11]|nr:hypothetical protein [Synergistaceae bacterium OttesenSCG-928-I11]
MKSKPKAIQRRAVAKFIKSTMARPRKRYPVVVWKISSMFPADLHAMFKRWQEGSDFRDVKLFKNETDFFDVLYRAFDAFELNWHIKTSYKREKVYFGNLRLKNRGCKLLMEIGAKTYIG